MENNRAFGTPLNVQNVSNSKYHGQSTEIQTSLQQGTPVDKMRAFKVEDKENSCLNVSKSPIIGKNGQVNFNDLKTPQVLAQPITCLPVPISHPSHPSYTGQFDQKQDLQVPKNFGLGNSQNEPKQISKIEMGQMDWAPKTQFHQTKEQPFDFVECANKM